MPALPTETVAPKDALPVFRYGLWSVAGLTVLWVLFLAVITWRTANPPVVNGVQVQVSDRILVGRWENRADGRFEVTQELKRGDPLGVVTVTGVPDRGTPTNDLWVIPVLKFGGTYSVTHGQFVNHPWRRLPAADAQEWEVRVNPQCYPATDDVLEQINAVLSAARPAAKP